MGYFSRWMIYNRRQLQLRIIYCIAHNGRLSKKKKTRDLPSVQLGQTGFSILKIFFLLVCNDVEEFTIVYKII